MAWCECTFPVTKSDRRERSGTKEVGCGCAASLAGRTRVGVDVLSAALGGVPVARVTTRASSTSTKQLRGKGSTASSAEHFAVQKLRISFTASLRLCLRAWTVLRCRSRSRNATTPIGAGRERRRPTPLRLCLRLWTVLRGHTDAAYFGDLSGCVARSRPARDKSQARAPDQFQRCPRRPRSKPSPHGYAVSASPRARRTSQGSRFPLRCARSPRCARHRQSGPCRPRPSPR